jgi:hypothetical protein
MQQNNHDTELMDIRNITVDSGLPRAMRIAEFARQIQNPRHYRCGEFIITAEFSKDGPKIEQCLQGLMT